MNITSDVYNDAGELIGYIRTKGPGVFYPQTLDGTSFAAERSRQEAEFIILSYYRDTAEVSSLQVALSELLRLVKEKAQLQHRINVLTEQVEDLRRDNDAANKC